jgi:hypothetical protein
MSLVPRLQILSHAVATWNLEGVLNRRPACQTRKSETRISKHETNPNDQNTNNRNKWQVYAVGKFVLNFENSDFDIVSDFGFRYSDFVIGITAP